MPIQSAPQAGNSMESAEGPELIEPGAMARVDFALRSGNLLLIYGWILDFATSIQAASIRLGDLTIDLVEDSWRVHRSDVAQHFSRAASDDLHGFYILVELIDKSAAFDQLVLTCLWFSGQAHESIWTVGRYGEMSDEDLTLCVTALGAMLRQLPRHEVRRLLRFVSAGQQSGMLLPSETLPPPVQMEFDLSCVLEDRVLLLCGRMNDPAHELKSVRLNFGQEALDFLEGLVFISPQDARPDRTGQAPLLRGFLFVKMLTLQCSGRGEVKFTINAASDDPIQFFRPVCMNPHEARQQLFALIERLPAGTAFALMAYVHAAVEGSSELAELRAAIKLNLIRIVERLPKALQLSDTGFGLHIDQAIPVAHEGVLLSGWYFDPSRGNSRVDCHSLNGSTYAVSDNWIRHPRVDVTTYLSSVGIQSGSHEHGFTCYIPIEPDCRPHYLSVTAESGELHRIYVPMPEDTRSPLEIIRALLSTFESHHRQLRLLMDRQVGPAVRAVWSARSRPARKELIENYGAAPAKPIASIIVPLYGRYDLAEYQMALFADDPEFQQIDLIYVVDDPAILEPFIASCRDLYGIYRVPFSVVFAGFNQGYAGANNFGADKARGDYIFLMNSDVMPRRKRWAGEMLRIYQSLDRPGMLGARLVYEDGSLQHAGMAFRRYAPYGNLWINDHTMKGQRADGVGGTKEVDAVTAALALVDTKLYRELGGFSDDYIIGDFEDSDLCLRCRSAGRRNYVALDVELYHLERQSQERIGEAVWRRNLTVYNCWLHTERWGAVIEQTSSGAASLAKDDWGHKRHQDAGAGARGGVSP